ncbi:MAG: UDP-N-acetylmuramoyl-L-alanyl-D-glutamate--2,6-diaminopimelate ligase [Candidatus Nealsonbacteria bacterium]
MQIKEIFKKIIPDFLLAFYHYLLALLGAFLYGFPSKDIKVIGITGTSGKTTAVNLTTAILEQAGYKVACLSSIRFKIGDKELENKLKMTMPGRFKIHKFLKQAKKEKCQYAVLEITSEGIKQYRHKFIDFTAVVFTNLSPEHIEAHKGFENYRKAKLKLFKNTKNIHIVNLDDKNAEYFLDYRAKEKWGYNIKIQNQNKGRRREESWEEVGPLSRGRGSFVEVRPLERERKITNQKELKIIEADNIEILENGIDFRVKSTQFNLNLLGKFNVYNSLSAICVGLSQGVSLENCKIALERIKGVSGRMEIVIKEPFKVVVDYAHTPEALEKVYKTIKGSMFHVSGSMLCVLGSCGGGRDKWKRPVLGELAEKYCKEIIITNEDPYEENPMEIIEQVVKGAKGKAKIIVDRRQAIRQALEIAKPNDVIIITGKGSEPWMCVKDNQKIPWDDRQIVKEEFQKLK